MAIACARGLRPIWIADACGGTCCSHSIQGARHVRSFVAAVLLATLLGGSAAWAQALPEPAADGAAPAGAADEAAAAKAQAFLGSLKPKSGLIALPGGIAELALDDR